MANSLSRALNLLTMNKNEKHECVQYLLQGESPQHQSTMLAIWLKDPKKANALLHEAAAKTATSKSSGKSLSEIKNEYTDKLLIAAWNDKTTKNDPKFSQRFFEQMETSGFVDHALQSFKPTEPNKDQNASTFPNILNNIITNKEQFSSLCKYAPNFAIRLLKDHGENIAGLTESSWRLWDVLAEYPRVYKALAKMKSDILQKIYRISYQNNVATFASYLDRRYYEKNTPKNAAFENLLASMKPTELTALAESNPKIARVLFKKPSLLKGKKEREGQLIAILTAPANQHDLPLAHLAIEQLGKKKIGNLSDLSQKTALQVLIESKRKESSYYFSESITPEQHEQNASFVIQHRKYAGCNKENIGYIFAGLANSTDLETITKLTKVFLDTNNQEFLVFLDDVAAKQAGIEALSTSTDERYNNGVTVLQNAIFNGSKKEERQALVRVIAEKRPAFRRLICDSGDEMSPDNIKRGKNIVPLLYPEKKDFNFAKEISRKVAKILPIAATGYLTTAILKEYPKNEGKNWFNSLKNAGKKLLNKVHSLIKEFDKKEEKSVQAAFAVEVLSSEGARDVLQLFKPKSEIDFKSVLLNSHCNEKLIESIADGEWLKIFHSIQNEKNDEELLDLFKRWPLIITKFMIMTNIQLVDLVYQRNNSSDLNKAFFFRVMTRFLIEDPEALNHFPKETLDTIAPAAQNPVDLKRLIFYKSAFVETGRIEQCNPKILKEILDEVENENQLVFLWSSLPSLFPLSLKALSFELADLVYQREVDNYAEVEDAEFIYHAMIRFLTAHPETLTDFSAEMLDEVVAAAENPIDLARLIYYKAVFLEENRIDKFNPRALKEILTKDEIDENQFDFVWLSLPPLFPLSLNVMKFDLVDLVYQREFDAEKYDENLYNLYHAMTQFLIDHPEALHSFSKEILDTILPSAQNYFDLQLLIPYEFFLEEIDRADQPNFLKLKEILEEVTEDDDEELLGQLWVSSASLFSLSIKALSFDLADLVYQREFNATKYDANTAVLYRKATQFLIDRPDVLINFSEEKLNTIIQASKSVEEVHKFSSLLIEVPSLVPLSLKALDLQLADILYNRKNGLSDKAQQFIELARAAFITKPDLFTKTYERKELIEVFKSARSNSELQMLKEFKQGSESFFDEMPPDLERSINPRRAITEFRDFNSKSANSSEAVSEVVRKFKGAASKKSSRKDYLENALCSSFQLVADDDKEPLLAEYIQTRSFSQILKFLEKHLPNFQEKNLKNPAYFILTKPNLQHALAEKINKEGMDKVTELYKQDFYKQILQPCKRSDVDKFADFYHAVLASNVKHLEAIFSQDKQEIIQYLSNNKEAAEKMENLLIQLFQDIATPGSFDRTCDKETVTWLAGNIKTAMSNGIKVEEISDAWQQAKDRFGTEAQTLVGKLVEAICPTKPQLVWSARNGSAMYKAAKVPVEESLQPAKPFVAPVKNMSF